ncbi:DUF3626 domain-containing protein [Micromonospora chalcea]|uniref:DUF3626 domain-containing protein n=1 Tax=Micromonospora sp. D75 TaxID=2824885 RepID=UPI001FFD9A72|nr:DUF3626 domain-containing protein [Micromonospora sp. D75]
MRGGRRRERLTLNFQPDRVLRGGRTVVRALDAVTLQHLKQLRHALVRCGVSP